MRLAISKCRSHTFFLVFLLVPLSVFVIFSLSRPIKLNWTGPIWLSGIPVIAYFMPVMAFEKNTISRWFFGAVSRVWLPTIVSILLIYGALLHYLSLGFPGLPFPQNVFPAGYKSLGQQIEKIEDDIESRTGFKPIVVGMDKYKTASLLAFYRPENQTSINEQCDRESILYTIGSFEEARQLMAKIDSLKIISLLALDQGQPYRIRAKAELSKLVFPLHLHRILFFLSIWDVETDWYEFDFTF